MRVKVWDGAVRLLHWTLVLSVAVATLSLWWLVGLHQPAGYVALAAVGLRLLWGCCFAPRAGYARFAQFLRSPRATLAYLRQLRQGREARYIGHNPLGGWMVLALMACVAGLALSGWLYTSDWLWGNERVEQVHLALAWLLGVLVSLHVAGVLFTSLRHRENLVRAMFSGSKRAPGEGDIS
jgi:cytochrome b